MGVIGKLAFWRRSSKKVTAVEPFAAPLLHTPKNEAAKATAAEPYQAPMLMTPKSDTAKVPPQAVLIAPVDELSIALASGGFAPAQAMDVECPQDGKAPLGNRVSSSASSSSSHRGATSPLSHRSVAEVAGPTAQADGATLPSPDADELEAELCDEVLFALPFTMPEPLMGPAAVQMVAST